MPTASPPSACSRVIRGYGEGKNAVEGTGGSFSYYELGEPLLIGENLNEAVEPEKIREYIWFMETKTPYAPAAGDNPYYLGQHNDTGYYFYYEPQRITVLDYDFLATVTEKAGGTVIYADRCSIDDSKLSQMGIVFKKIPRDISRCKEATYMELKTYQRQVIADLTRYLELLGDTKEL